jgi:hypothetical protein
MDPAMMNQTKKQRRVQLSNLPLYLNIDEESIKKVVSDYLIRNYLADPNNSTPILSCEINKKDKTCVLELSSVEEANRFSKIKDIMILNVTCKVTKLGESMYGSTMNLSTVLQNANNTAKAQAAAFQAINMMSTSDGRLELDVKDLNLESSPESPSASQQSHQNDAPGRPQPGAALHRKRVQADPRRHLLRVLQAHPLRPHLHHQEPQLDHRR